MVSKPAAPVHKRPASATTSSAKKQVVVVAAVKAPCKSKESDFLPAFVEASLEKFGKVQQARVKQNLSRGFLMSVA